jgi:hypothetical protein
VLLRKTDFFRISIFIYQEISESHNSNVNTTDSTPWNAENAGIPGISGNWANSFVGLAAQTTTFHSSGSSQVSSLPISAFRQQDFTNGKQFGICTKSPILFAFRISLVKFRSHIYYTIYSTYSICCQNVRTSRWLDCLHRITASVYI